MRLANLIGVDIMECTSVLKGTDAIVFKADANGK